MRNIFILAKKDILLLFREKTFLALLIVFIFMASISTFIGWSTVNTLTNVYHSAVAELASVGQTAPPFPLSGRSSLEIMKNIIIYVVLIGSLLAIILGYFIGIDDRIAGVNKIIFIRPLQRLDFWSGKFFAIFVVLLAVLASAFLVSALSLLIFKIFSLAALLRLLNFYGLSFLYLAGFAFISLSLALRLKNSAVALLMALLTWMTITFALPEMGSALFPTESLNPVLPDTQVLQSPALAIMHTAIYPFSISEHFKQLSNDFFQISSPPVLVGKIEYSAGINFATIFFWFAFTAFGSLLVTRKIQPTEQDKLISA
ncbi:MAG: hypothetical protein V2A63_04680 [Patescibacteria group bacterium]